MENNKMTNAQEVHVDLDVCNAYTNSFTPMTREQKIRDIQLGMYEDAMFKSPKVMAFSDMYIKYSEEAKASMHPYYMSACNELYTTGKLTKFALCADRRLFDSDSDYADFCAGLNRALAVINDDTIPVCPVVLENIKFDGMDDIKDDVNINVEDKADISEAVAKAIKGQADETLKETKFEEAVKESDMFDKMVMDPLTRLLAENLSETTAPLGAGMINKDESLDIINQLVELAKQDLSAEEVDKVISKIASDAADKSINRMNAENQDEATQCCAKDAHSRIGSRIFADSGIDSCIKSMADIFSEDDPKRRIFTDPCPEVVIVAPKKGENIVDAIKRSIEERRKVKEDIKANDEIPMADVMSKLADMYKKDGLSEGSTSYLRNLSVQAKEIVNTGTTATDCACTKCQNAIDEGIKKYNAIKDNAELTINDKFSIVYNYMISIRIED